MTEEKIDPIVEAREWLETALDSGYTEIDKVSLNIAQTHALISIAKSLATLASAVGDYGSTVPYVRTGKVGGG